MPLYRYQQSSIIREVEIASPMGQPQAVLHPDENASAQELQDLRQNLTAKGIHSAIDRVDGKDVLVAHALDPKNPTSFLAILEQIKAVSGQPSAEPSKLDEKKGGLLKFSSYLYTAGNISEMLSGIFRAKHEGGFKKDTLSEFGVGATFTLGDLVLMLFSEGKGTRKMQLFGHALAKELLSEGIDSSASLPTIPEKRRGIVGQISDWFTSNVLRVKGASETTAGFLKIQSGLGKQTANGREDFNIGKTLAGVAIVSGWTPLLLAPNSTPPDTSVPRPKHEGVFGPVLDGVDAVGDYFRGDVRGRWTRPLALSNNGFSVYGAVRERAERHKVTVAAEEKVKSLKTVGGEALNQAKAELKKAKEREGDVTFNFITQAFFIAANFVYGMSGSKREGVISEEERTEDSVITSTANLILKLSNPQERLLAAHKAGQVMRKMTLTSKSVEQIVAAIGQRAVEIGGSKFASDQERKIASEIAGEIAKETTHIPTTTQEVPATSNTKTKQQNDAQANHLTTLEEASKEPKKNSPHQSESLQISHLMNNPVSAQIH